MLLILVGVAALVGCWFAADDMGAAFLLAVLGYAALGIGVVTLLWAVIRRSG